METNGTVFEDVFLSYHASPLSKGTPFLEQIPVSQVVKFSLRE